MWNSCHQFADFDSEEEAYALQLNTVNTLDNTLNSWSVTTGAEVVDCIKTNMDGSSNLHCLCAVMFGAEKAKKE